MSETNVQLFPGVFRSVQGGANPDFFLHSAGRVGIGNQAPATPPAWDANTTFKLNVTGHTHVNGNLDVSGYLYGDGSTLSGVTAVIGGYWDLDQANNNIKYDVGNVGIGGAAGTEKLTVHGDLNLDGGNLKLNGQNAVFSNWTSHTNGIYRSTNVGIGDVPSSTEALKVHGNMIVDGDIRYISIAPIALPTLYDHISAGRNGTGIYPIVGTQGGNTVYNVYCEPEIYGGGWMCFAQVPRIPDQLIYNYQGRNWNLFTDAVGNSAVLLKSTGGTGARRHSTFSVPMNILTSGSGYDLDVLLMAYGDNLRHNGSAGAKCGAVWRGVNLSQAFDSEHASAVGTSGLASSTDGVDFTSQSFSLTNSTGWDFSISGASGMGSYQTSNEDTAGWIVHTDTTSGGFTLYCASIRGPGGAWGYTPNTGFEYVRFFVRPSSF